MGVLLLLLCPSRSIEKQSRELECSRTNIEFHGSRILTRWCRPKAVVEENDAAAIVFDETIKVIDYIQQDDEEAENPISDPYGLYTEPSTDSSKSSSRR